MRDRDGLHTTKWYAMDIEHNAWEEESILSWFESNGVFDWAIHVQNSRLLIDVLCSLFVFVLLANVRRGEVVVHEHFIADRVFCY